jgi:small-conductance mechanosensitive channel
MFLILWRVMMDLIVTITNMVVTAATAVISVIIAESFAKKREIRDRKLRIKIEYLNEYAKMLQKLVKQTGEISRNVENCLCKINPDSRKDKYSDVVKSLSEFNDDYISSMLLANCFVKSMEINLSIEDPKQYIREYADNLFKILNNYMSNPDTSNATKEINEFHLKATEQIEAEMKKVTDYICELTKKL